MGISCKYEVLRIVCHRSARCSGRYGESILKALYQFNGVQLLQMVQVQADPVPYIRPICRRPGCPPYHHGPYPWRRIAAV